MVRQVQITIHFFSSFVNPCIDIIAQAIYRAYDDGADISEYLHLVFLRNKSLAVL